MKCLPDATRDCKEIDITLNALDANGVKNGQVFTATLTGMVVLVWLIRRAMIPIVRFAIVTFSTIILQLEIINSKMSYPVHMR